MAKKSKRMMSLNRGKAGAASAVEFNPDYTHVKKDLKRIGILAGSIFATLILLSFIIQ